MTRESGLRIYDVVRHQTLPKPSAMGIATIQEAQRRFAVDPKWARFRYLYWTEADQILHTRARHFHKLFAPLAADNAAFDRAARAADADAALPPQARAYALARVPEEFPRFARDADGARWAAAGAALAAERKLSVLTLHRFHDVPRSEDMLAALEDTRDQLAARARAKRGLGADGAGDWSDVRLDVNEDEFLPRDGGVGEHAQASVRRDLESFADLALTRFDDALDGGSCCYVSAGETAPRVPPATLTSHRDVRGQNDLYDYKTGGREARFIHDGVTEMFAVGAGLAMVAGDCCFICVRKQRYCNDVCTPRLFDTATGGYGGGQGACAIGEYSDFSQPEVER